MNTTNAAVGAGTIVLLGRWSEGDGMDVRVVVGVMFLAFALAVLPDRLAIPFAWLILATVVYRYAPGLIGRSGITQSNGGNRQRGGTVRI